MSPPPPPPSPAPACTATEAPPPPPEIKQDVNIWSPGGKPGDLRHAAAAWRSMADTVESVAANLDGAVGRALRHWEGPASTAFGRHWHDLHAGLTREALPHLRDVAAKLDETADVVEEINDQVHDLYVSIGVAVGAGVALSVVTLGFSAAASAAAAAAAAARAGVLVTRMAAFLTGVANALRAANLVRNYAKAWGIAAAANTAGVGVQRAITNPNHNPFDGWNLDDVSSIINVSTATGLTAGTAQALAPAAIAARPYTAAAGVGALGNGSGSALNDALGGDPIDWSDAAVNGAFGAAGGLGSTGIARGINRIGAGRPPAPTPATHAPSASGLHVPPPAGPTLARPQPPSGFTTSPSGLLVPNRPLPPGYTTRPSGLLVPGTPAGYERLPSGVLAPIGSTRPVAAPVIVDGDRQPTWDDLLGAVTADGPANGVANVITSDGDASTDAPAFCVPAGR